jgi:hypothetical protein
MYLIKLAMCECFHLLKYKTPEQWRSMLLNLMRKERKKEPDAHTENSAQASVACLFLPKISSRADAKYPKVMLFNKRRGTQYRVWVKQKNSLLWRWRAFTFVSGAIIISEQLTRRSHQFLSENRTPDRKTEFPYFIYFIIQRQASDAGRSQSDEKRIRAENAIK